MNQAVLKLLPWKLLSRLPSAARILASPAFSIVLLVVVAGVLGWGTLLEAAWGREYARWYVYDSRWFPMLWGLLGSNVLAATLLRWQWQRAMWRRQGLSLLITQVGLLVLLAGAVQTYLTGIEGELILREGEDASEFVVRSHSVIKIVHSSGPRKISTELSFCPGPIDWSEGSRLDFGLSRGLGVKIVKFVRHASEYCSWVPDERDYQGPALRLRLDNAQGNMVAEDWLAATGFGGEAILGPTGYQLWPLPVASMLSDFLQPPADGMGSTGVLSMHYDGKMYREPVDGKVGARLPIGDSGMEVEILGYHPDARPSPDGGFYSRSPRTSNPLLELKLHRQDGQPITQLAFARRPLLTTDGVTGTICPVRFWYHHPDVPPTPGADFAQTPDAALYCRTTVNDRRVGAREIHEGDRVPLGSQFSLVLLQYIPRARQDKGFRPTETPRDADSAAEAAALVEVEYEGMRQQIWMKREDPQYGFASMVTRQGRVMLSFDYQRLPLGRTVKLHDVLRDSHAPDAKGEVIASDVEVKDDGGTILGQQRIGMNRPLSCGKYTLHQPLGREGDRNKKTVVLTVAYDPGRFFKYAGSGMICAGMLLMLVRRSHLFGRLPGTSSAFTADGHERDSSESEVDRPSSSCIPRPLALGRLAPSRHCTSDTDTSTS